MLIKNLKKKKTIVLQTNIFMIMIITCIASYNLANGSPSKFTKLAFPKVAFAKSFTLKNPNDWNSSHIFPNL